MFKDEFISAFRERPLEWGERQFTYCLSLATGPLFFNMVICKAQVVSELALTPLWRTLTESGHELILGHSLQTLIGRIVGKLYPRNPKHIRNKMWCDRNGNTLDMSNKMRYGVVNPVHVGVELQNQHEGTSDGLITKRLPFLNVNDSGKVGVKKNDRSEWMPCREKFSINALWASSLWKRRERGAWSEKEEAPEWRGFRTRVDLRLGAIDITNIKKIEREKKKTIRKAPKQFIIVRICEKMYKCMEKCMNMWHAK